MTMKHLTPQQFIALLEGTPDAASRSHLVTCVPCQGEVDALRSINATISNHAAVPEPSPLFWPHFASRVRQSVAAEPMTPSWWNGMWRPIAGVCVALTCVALVVVVNMTRLPDAGAPEFAAAGTLAEPLDPSGELVAQMASSVSWEDLKQIVPTSTDGASDMLAALTPAERAAFVRLLKSHVGGDE
jgi:hypothetical protein